MKTNQPTEINDSEEEKSQIRRQSGKGNILEDRLSDATQIIELLYKFHFVSLGPRLPACENVLEDVVCGFLNVCKNSA